MVAGAVVLSEEAKPVSQDFLLGQRKPQVLHGCTCKLFLAKKPTLAQDWAKWNDVTPLNRGVWLLRQVVLNGSQTWQPGLGYSCWGKWR